MPRLCKLHPLTDAHVETLALLVNEAIEDGRTDTATTHDQLAALFELRGVIAAMQKKPAASKPRRPRTTNQTTLPTITLAEEQSA